MMDVPVLGLSSSLYPPFESLYTLASGRVLGSGVSGLVRECLDNMTGEKLACKSIFKSKLRCLADLEGVEHEIQLMAGLPHHPNIVGFRGAFEDSECIHLVMDLCDGGELFDYIRTEQFLPEAHAAELFHQIGQAVQLLHSQGEHGTLHRDLKPENILLARTREKRAESEKLQVKLADFGLALELPAECVHGAFAGSPLYMAPEVVSRDHVTIKTDQWSLGVIMYAMLSGELPFGGESNAAIFKSIQRGVVCTGGPRWEKISFLAKDLVYRLLDADPSRRPSSTEMLLHPWFRMHNVAQPVGCRPEYKQMPRDVQPAHRPARHVAWGTVTCHEGVKRRVRWGDDVAAAERLQDGGASGRPQESSPQGKSGAPVSGYRRRGGDNDSHLHESEGEEMVQALTPRNLFPCEPSRAVNPAKTPAVRTKHPVTPLSPPFGPPCLEVSRAFPCDHEFESPTSTMCGPSPLSVPSVDSPAESLHLPHWPSPPVSPNPLHQSCRSVVSNPNLGAQGSPTSPTTAFSFSLLDSGLSVSEITRRKRARHIRSSSDLPLSPPGGQNSYKGAGAIKRWRYLKRKEMLAELQGGGNK